MNTVVGAFQSEDDRNRLATHGKNVLRTSRPKKVESHGNWRSVVVSPDQINYQFRGTSGQFRAVPVYEVKKAF